MNGVDVPPPKFTGLPHRGQDGVRPRRVHYIRWLFHGSVDGLDQLRAQRDEWVHVSTQLPVHDPVSFARQVGAIARKGKQAFHK